VNYATASIVIGVLIVLIRLTETICTMFPIFGMIAHEIKRPIQLLNFGFVGLLLMLPPLVLLGATWVFLSRRSSVAFFVALIIATTMIISNCYYLLVGPIPTVYQMVASIAVLILLGMFYPTSVLEFRRRFNSGYADED